MLVAYTGHFKYQSMENTMFKRHAIAVLPTLPITALSTRALTLEAT